MSIRHLRPLAAGLAGTALAAGMLAFGAGAAHADGAGLPPVLAKFANCPVQNPDVSACYYIVTSTSELKAGSVDLNTSSPIVLQFGTIPDLTGNTANITVAPINGVSVLTAPAIPVPGGLLHLPWSPGGPLAAYVTPTIVGLPTLNLNNLNTATNEPVMSLKIKGKVSNPFTDVLSGLGSGCYIGSDSSPIQLNLTTGTTAPPGPNQPISGVPGTFNFDNLDSGVIEIDAQTVVDNAWGLPHASGCGAIPYVGDGLDWAVDLDDGQANAGPGHNSATLHTTIYEADANAVRTALAAPGNKLDDAGFESAGMGPWTCAAQCGVDHGLGNAHTGTSNGWVRNTTGWNDIHQDVAVAPNTNYTLTGWIRTSGNNSAGYFGVRDLSTNVIGETEYNSLPGYTQLTVHLNTGNNTQVEVYGGLWALNQDTWAQLDDISLTAD